MPPFLIGYINLIKTILGTGTIAYPFLITSNGLIPSICASILSCFFSTFGLLIYAKLNYQKNKTMSTLSKNPQIIFWINSVIVLKCISVSISYIVILKEIIRCICDNYGFTHNNYIFIILLILTIPVSTIKEFSKLRFTSFIGLSATILMLLFSFMRFFTCKKNGSIHAFRPFHFNTIGSYVFAFTCHQNIFTFQNEFDITLKMCNLVIITTMISALVVYILFGCINSYVFDIGENFFDSLIQDKITLFMQICFFLTLIFAIPLQLNAAQYYISINKIHLRYIFTSFVYFVAIIIAFMKISFNVVLSLIGGTVSSMICFIISGLYYILLAKQKSGLFYYMSLSTLIFGLIIFFSTLYLNIENISNKF